MYSIEQINNPLMRLDAQKIEAFLNQALHTEYETEQKEFEEYKRMTGWDNTYRIKKIEELEKISQQDIIQCCHHILSEIPDTQNIHPVLNRFLGFSYHNYKLIQRNKLAIKWLLQAQPTVT